MRFILISFVYLVVGALWMGLGPTPVLPSPTSALASEIYDTARVHVMVLGWASLALMGILYYLVPKMRGKEEVYSKKIASIHFWLTNVTIPIGIVVVTYVSFVIDSLVNSGISEATVMGTPTVTPLLTAFLVLVGIGLAAQLSFIYNVYKTLGA
jgi:cytochrome c oxidase cbb3-type subunit 1